MTSRLQKKKVLNLTNGPMVTLQVCLLKYECESREPLSQRDTLDNSGTIEVEVVMTDESGMRFGGGKAAIVNLGSSPEGAMKGAEKRIVSAIGEYLRKSARVTGVEAPDPDDSP
jgi:hypothetical protein